MDEKIYFSGGREPGVVVARRVPRGHGATGFEGIGGSGGSGGGASASPAVSGGGTSLNVNPIGIAIFTAQAAIAPHASTLRSSYTVPPNRRAKIQTAFIEIRRATVAAPAADASGFIVVRRAPTGTPAGSFLAVRTSDNNAPNRTFEQLQGDAIELFEGDQCEIRTADASTGGTVNFNIEIHIVEFDAIEKSGVGVGGDAFAAAAASLALASGSTATVSAPSTSVLAPRFAQYTGSGFLTRGWDNPQYGY